MLADAAWPSVVRETLVLVPLGSTEQHGPHLPLSTDTVIAAAVAAGAAAALAGPVTVAPALPYGASGEHAGFPGTVSLGHEALAAVLVETVRSLGLWAGRTVFVNGHGGNTEALRRAAGRLRTEGHDTAWTPCAAPGGDAHAGFTETSLMLHLAPQSVLPHHAVTGDRRPLAELLPALRAHGVAAVSPSGVLGDPAGAGAEHGRRILAEMTSGAARRVTAWRPGPDGLLS
ncbi:mycofactocin biosynthesis peptidyl-dipeptidase MftE [Actinocorallia longicatena]|uniref:Mycofactocin biosynthesis peptidyl-dipeptidase MftE n=1 Tax=Actinocorallia longicatena TaxID=111803 RepID=A0ABP6Q7Q1_9ACTN